MQNVSPHFSKLFKTILSAGILVDTNEATKWAENFYVRRASDSMVSLQVRVDGNLEIAFWPWQLKEGVFLFIAKRGRDGYCVFAIERGEDRMYETKKLLALCTNSDKETLERDINGIGKKLAQWMSTIYDALNVPI
jgi:hypothetical protein